MTDRAVEQIEERRDDLEDLAASDLPAAWIAQELLDAADERGDRA